MVNPWVNPRQWMLLLLLLLFHCAGSFLIRQSRPVRHRQRCAHPVASKFVLGLNKYSHDATACLLSLDGKQSVVVPKERVTRSKHDGGDAAIAVEHALEAVGASTDDIVAVCVNNHHFRVAPFEQRLPWSVSLGIYPESAVSPLNLLPGIPSFELSHHLAHVWSAITQAPFDRGVVLVMDGMGETHAAMAEARACA